MIPRTETAGIAGEPVAPGGCGLAASLDDVCFAMNGSYPLASACEEAATPR